ncbi:MAG: helix-turn-helix domain-containing protein [Deltaproteobacteria bacterium]|nr:helix-turn-helix domain-containing protein [Deltaproteobacteria bacterium]
MTPKHPITRPIDGGELELLTVDEVAALFKMTRRAVYAAVERGHLPGVVRLGGARRSIRFRRARLIEFLRENSVASPGEPER